MEKYLPSFHLDKLVSKFHSAALSEENAVNRLNHDFLCRICLQIVKSPVKCSECESVFCELCFDTWQLKSSSCPGNCKQDPVIVQKLGRFERNALNETQFCCPKCNEKFLYERCESHMKSCKFRDGTCPAECGATQLNSRE